MKKLALILFAAASFAFGQTPVNVQKTSGTNAITGSLVIGDGKTLTATGTGTIVATSAASVSGNVTITSADTLTINGVITGTPTSGTLSLANTTLTLPNSPTFGGTWSGAQGGTGVANTGKTITLGGNVTTSGAFGLTLTLTGTTGVTLPTTGTLATLAGSETLTNKSIALGSNTLTGTSAQLATAISDETGSGSLVFATSPTFTTPILGAATATSVQAATSAGLLINNNAGTTVMTIGPGSGTGVAFNASGLTSVNSVTANTTTDLTLSGGSSGASLVLGQGANGAASFTLPGSGGLTATQTRNGQAVIRLTNASTGTGAFANIELVNSGFTGSLYQFGTAYTTSGRFVQDSLLLDSGGTGGLAFGATNGNITWYQGGNNVSMRLSATNGNLLIGTTTDMSGSGGLKVAGTTASTSTTTGSATFAGGVGIAGNAISGGVVRTGSFTVATLPTASVYPGGLAYVTDANATTRLSTVAGGGSNKVMVYSDGTNWLIL